MTRIAIEGLTKRFGRTAAVDGVDASICSGELFFLLGPSGCGKTTLLRMLAGFVEPTSGTICFDDHDVTRLPANRRNAGMVFQSYALWPHMSVFDNVAYGLKVRRVPGDRKRRRVREALEAVRMAEYESRKPNELSGGQQQRVALARALVVEPAVLLLDEPLSNLDAKLRLEMRVEIRRLCDQTGITTVYVTHDQKEALSMADRVAILRDGRVVQLGAPRDLYARPASRFVADFLGETNFVPGVVVECHEGRVTINTPAGRLISSCSSGVTTTGTSVTCCLRPEALRFVADTASAENHMTGCLVETVYLGEMSQHVIKVNGCTLLKIVELGPKAGVERSAELCVTIDPNEVVVLAG